MCPAGHPKANFDGCGQILYKNQLQQTLQKTIFTYFYDFLRNLFSEVLSRPFSKLQNDNKIQNTTK